MRVCEFAQTFMLDQHQVTRISKLLAGLIELDLDNLSTAYRSEQPRTWKAVFPTRLA
jgi:hypothetical protein